MRRTMHVLEGLGPQDPANRFDHSQESKTAYDHPYFGQIFLSSTLSLLGFPYSLSSDNTLSYVQSLYMSPRLIMGILAVFDTFLVYKIGEIRYNRNVAFITAMLFAVMPLTWLLKRTVLDSIQLPFLLLSVLFVLYYNNALKNSYGNRNGNAGDVHKMLLFLSGLFLGLGIFTKAPAFTMIPLIVFLIIENKGRFKRNLKSLLVWFVPVILIPAIWPAYGISVGQFGEWIDGLSWQASERQNRGLIFLFNVFWDIDPILLVLGGSGLIFSLIRKDLFLLIWIIPYFIFIYLVGWVSHFHLILGLPVFILGAAVLVNELLKILSIHFGESRPLITNVLKVSVLLTILASGLISSLIMITTNLSFHQFEVAAYIADNTNKAFENESDEGNVTIISGPVYSWIFKYPFNKTSVLSGFRDSSQPVQSQVLMAIDQFYKGWVKRESMEEETQVEAMEAIYKMTNVSRVFEAPYLAYDRDTYPFTGLGHGRIGASDVEIRTNY